MGHALALPGRLQDRADRCRPRCPDHRGQRGKGGVGDAGFGGTLGSDRRHPGADGDDGVDVGGSGQYPDRPCRSMIGHAMMLVGLKHLFDEGTGIIAAALRQSQPAQCLRR